MSFIFHLSFHICTTKSSTAQPRKRTQYLWSNYPRNTKHTHAGLRGILSNWCLNKAQRFRGNPSGYSQRCSIASDLKQPTSDQQKEKTHFWCSSHVGSLTILQFRFPQSETKQNPSVSCSKEIYFFFPPKWIVIPELQPVSNKITSFSAFVNIQNYSELTYINYLLICMSPSHTTEAGLFRMLSFTSSRSSPKNRIQWNTSYTDGFY